MAHRSIGVIPSLSRDLAVTMFFVQTHEKCSALGHTFITKITRYERFMKCSITNHPAGSAVLRTACRWRADSSRTGTRGRSGSCRAAVLCATSICKQIIFYACCTTEMRNHSLDSRRAAHVPARVERVVGRVVVQMQQRFHAQRQR
ncbi:unnamed protein product [Sphagnum balticum]